MLDKDQSVLTLIGIKIASELEKRLPEVQEVFIERRQAIDLEMYDDDNQTPAAAVVYIQEEQIVDTAESPTIPIDAEIVDGEIVNADGVCCVKYNQIIRQFYQVEIIVQQGNGDYAICNRICKMVRQIIREANLSLAYDGSETNTSDSESSTSHYARAMRFYYEYEELN